MPSGGRFERELRKRGVLLLDPSRVLLECEQCGQRWSPNLLSGGRMPKGYWHCPNGCNLPDIQGGRPSRIPTGPNPQGQ